jgi:F-type H+-transporting ATPase subunit b
VELRDEVARLAVLSASKILDSEIDEQKNNKLVNNFISNISKN